MSATLKAEVLTKAAIRSYEEEVGIPVAGNAALEEQFECLRKIYLIHTTLGELTFRNMMQNA